METQSNKRDDPDMLKEYDFSKGVRGEYARRYAQRSEHSPIFPRVALALNRLCLGLWAGAVAFFVFVAAPAAFAALEPDNSKAGDVVEAILPRYYTAGFVLGGLALAGAIASRGAWNSKAAFAAEVLLIGLMLLCLAADCGWIWGTVHSLRADIPPGGLEPGTALYREFFKWHGISMVLNIAVLIATLAAAVVSHAPSRST
jgi:hypothetical protein